LPLVAGAALGAARRQGALFSVGATQKLNITGAGGAVVVGRDEESPRTSRAALFRRTVTIGFSFDKGVETMSINYRTTLRQLQTFTTPPQAAEVAPLIAALQEAGATYDYVGNDSLNNPTQYGAAVANWWNGSASSYWAELDRFARYVFSLASTADQTAAATAFGVAPPPPQHLPAALVPDVTLLTLSILSGRVAAAAAMTSVPAAVQGLLSTANALWSAARAARPPASINADNASNAAIAALQAALLPANAWLSAQAFS
jgi:hypothetical protein